MICDYVRDCASSTSCKLLVGDGVSTRQALRECLWRKSGQETSFDMEEQKKTEVVNHDPSFGSSLLSDDFGQKPTDDDIKALDPLKLEAAGKHDYRTDGTSVGAIDKSEEGQESTLDPLLQNPDGATQMFTDMHGVSSGLEGAPDLLPAKTGMRHMAGLTVGAQRLGITDWGSGTDGGRSGKPQDGVPYGSFTGV